MNKEQKPIVLMVEESKQTCPNCKKNKKPWFDLCFDCHEKGEVPAYNENKHLRNTENGVEYNKDGSIKTSEKLRKKLIRRRNIVSRNEKKHFQLKNKFFREYIFNLYKNKCCICGKSENLTIHHDRYEWVCPSEEKTEKPDCEYCHDFSKEFQDCISCVRLLCFGCHTKTHKQLEKRTGEWSGKKIC
jgi:hypothetical protein